MRSLKYYSQAFKVKLREFFNPYLGPIRRLFLHNAQFTIISNNCWAGHVYRFFNIEYLSPTVGLFIYSPDYIKFVKNIKHYLSEPLLFITWGGSKYKDDLELHGNTHCPIGKLDDIEIIFLHYKSEEEARTKWERRKSRIVWDNIYIKMTEQNECNEEIIKEFDKLPFKNKFIFVSKDYNIDSQVIFTEYLKDSCVKNDTVNFRKHINLIRFINGEPFKKRQPKKNAI